MQLAGILLMGFVSASADGTEMLPLTDSTRLEFATLNTGRAAVCRQDDFVNSLSRFDKQSRLRTDKAVSTEQYLAFAASHVRAWDEREKQKVAAAIDAIRPKLQRFELPFPEVIYFVRTTGIEESGNAYCRGNAIVLPANQLRRPTRQLERLITHELFHVLSSHNPELRRKLYAIVGFQPCAQVTVPQSLIDRKITNPDAPALDYAITLSLDGTERQAVPILVASVENYDPASGKSMFEFLEFRLIVVDSDDERSRPLLRDGEPVLLDARKLPAFFEKIGRNTNYIIHPEEVLADNFVHLVNGTDDLPTPQIVGEMRRILSR